MRDGSEGQERKKEMKGKRSIAHDHTRIMKAKERHAERRDIALLIAQSALKEGDWASFKGWVASALEESRRVELLNEACTIEGQSVPQAFRERAGDLFLEAVAKKGSAWHFLDGCISLLMAAEEIEKEELE